MNSTTVGFLGFSWFTIALLVALSLFASVMAGVFYTRYPDYTVAKLLNFLGGLIAALAIVSVMTRGYTWYRPHIFAGMLCLAMCFPTLTNYLRIKDLEERPANYTGP